MISRRDLLLSSASASAALPFAGTPIFAQQDYPNRDIHSICGFPPGTGADVFVRFYGRLLQDRVKRTVVTENRAGAARMPLHPHSICYGHYAGSERGLDFGRRQTSSRFL
jgi:hypothetical protein